MSATSFRHDGDIGWGKFDEKYNADLANGLGNLSARLSTMASKLISEKGLLVKAKPFIDFKKTVDEYTKAMGKMKIDEAMFIIWDAFRKIDKHITEHEPWKLIGKDNQYVGELLYADLESLRVLSYLLWPFMPDTAENLWQRFGFDPGKEKALPIHKSTQWGRLDSKSTLIKAAPLFPRI
jgi:methionyl-tRNA synthetase